MTTKDVQEFTSDDMDTNSNGVELIAHRPEPDLSMTYRDAMSHAVACGWERVSKDMLIDVPMVVVEWQPKVDRETLREYTVCYVVTEADHHLSFTDSGAGIRSQLEGYPAGYAVACPRGLRVSEYTVTGPGGSVVRAKTFYLS